jgi:CheY-like chemotaxis protein
MTSFSTPPRALVLYAENDENDALLMQACWKRAGLEPTLRIVDDGHSAKEYLAGEGQFADRESHPFPTLVLLDLSMPGCTGLEVLEWVRAQPRFADLPVLILSLSNQERDRADAFRLGASDYVVKPTGLAGFVETLRSWRERWFAGV